MALSDVLQFDCFVDNEIARNATKNFAGMLGKAFEQYKKLWSEYLKLRKHCEDADFKIPFQLLESNIYDNKPVTALNTSKVSENKKIFTSLYNNVYTNSNSDIDASLNDKFIDKQISEEKSLQSPILIKKRSKSKKTNITDNNFILENFEINETYPNIPIKENISILTVAGNNFREDAIFEKSQKNKILINENNDEIKCTPNKISQKLRINTLYNVDTTLLQNGKKLRQSKLMFLPDTQSINTATHESSNISKIHALSISKKDIEKLENYNKSIEEEVIQNSPKKHTELNSKIKCLRLKNKISNIKYSENKNLSTPKKIRKLEIEKNITPTEKRKYPESINQMFDNSSIYDETFCLLGEKIKQKSYDKNELKENKFENKNSPECPRIKKCLMNSFDIVPNKKEKQENKLSKKRSEREKMIGITCWECEKYYTNLGISEEEIKMRQNKCSRHRTTYNERINTPEGFWCPIFSDTTFQSTFQD